MKKYIVGFLVGAALTFALQAGAETLLDAKVDAVIQVEVDGENMGQAPVINGVSYLPVRKLGEKVGYSVGFKEGKATLTSDSADSIQKITKEAGDPVVTEVPEHYFTKDNIDEAIKSQEGSIRSATFLSEKDKGVNPTEDTKWKEHITKLETELERLKAIKAELESQQ